MNVTLGGIFQITCEPKGVPYPMVSWLHNGRTVTNTDNSNRRLTVEVKHFEMSGPIECVADNGVGQPAISGIVMLVHCEEKEGEVEKLMTHYCRSFFSQTRGECENSSRAHKSWGHDDNRMHCLIVSDGKSSLVPQWKTCAEKSHCGDEGK